MMAANLSAHARSPSTHGHIVRGTSTAPSPRVALASVPCSAWTRGATGLGESQWTRGATLTLQPPESTASAPTQPLRRLGPRAELLRTEQKVRVKLGPYRDGAIAASAPAPLVSEEAVEKAWQVRKGKTHEFERINFTGTGAKVGHTVKVNFEGKYADGPQAGYPIKGTKAAGYELELKDRDDEPWRTIVNEITVAGMGQEESKTFLVQFPVDYKAKPLAGLKARFTVNVTEIGVKKELPVDSRPDTERRAEVAAELKASAERACNEVLDAAIRSALLASSEADVQKVADSVTWAKFGEKSLADYKWNVLMEEVARVEDIPFESVLPFLRRQAKVTHT